MTFLPYRLLAALALVAGLLVASGSAIAGQDYDNCTGFIDSLPATISTQGTWCLDKNLATAITNGMAITIATNNVTIDCNDFKIGGLAAGNASLAMGIYAASRQNATVRHCNVRGFLYGIFLDGGAGHLVEDNRLDNNTMIGIQVYGDNNRVRRNAVYDTGGRPGQTTSWGIFAYADVIGNTVSGVFADGLAATVGGIRSRGNGNVARNNHVSGLQSRGEWGGAYGIRTSGLGTMVEGNHVAVPAATAGYGVYGESVDENVCSNNVVAGFANAMIGCRDAGRNVSLSL